MTDAILVLNAGSSSIKFSVFVRRNSGLDLALRGQVEGLYTSPRFVGKTGKGAIVSEKVWDEGVKLGHAGAIEHLAAFLRGHRGDMKLVGVGHRVVHGGTHYFEPALVNQRVVADLEQLVPLAPLHQPHNLAPIKI